MKVSFEQEFAKTNSLIFRKSTSHQIINLVKPQKNIQLKFILISKQPPVKTKKLTITQCLIADQTASIVMNFFGQAVQELDQGDICYISGAYTTYYKGALLFYQGQSLIRRIGKWYMRFNLKRNMTQQSRTNKSTQQEIQQPKTLNFKDE